MCERERERERERSSALGVGVVAVPLRKLDPGFRVEDSAFRDRVQGVRANRPGKSNL